MRLHIPAVLWMTGGLSPPAILVTAQTIDGCAMVNTTGSVSTGRTGCAAGMVAYEYADRTASNTMAGCCAV